MTPEQPGTAGPPRLGVLLVGAALLPVAFAAPAARAQERAGAPDEATIRAVVDGFHAALVAGDSTGALVYLHPDLIVYESGHAETLAEYRSGHLAADIDFSRATSFQTIRDAVVRGSGLSLYLREYLAQGIFRDKTIDAFGVETVVLSPAGSVWKIRHIHWSSR